MIEVFRINNNTGYSLCEACDDDPDDLADIIFGKYHISLCPSCARELHKGLEALPKFIEPKAEVTK